MSDSLHVDLSPHFVFNALNSVISLCRKEPDKASEVLVALSECLHYSNLDYIDLVSIEEELDFIQNYLFIQSIRFGSRIKVIYDIDENIKYNILKHSIYKAVSQLIDNEIKTCREDFTVKIKIAYKHTLSVSIWINDICRWEKEY